MVSSDLPLFGSLWGFGPLMRARWLTRPLPGNDDRFPKLPNGERDIIHSHNHVDTWKQMEKLVATGKTKAIGVSNVCAPRFLPTNFQS